MSRRFPDVTINFCTHSLLKDIRNKEPILFRTMISAKAYVEADQSLRLKKINDGHDFLRGSIQAEGV